MLVSHPARKLRVTAGSHTASISIGLRPDLTLLLPLEKVLVTLGYKGEVGGRGEKEQLRSWEKRKKRR